MIRTFTRDDFQAAIDRARAQQGHRKVRTTGVGRWMVSGNNAVYTVREDDTGEWFCSCPARGLCWHMAAAWSVKASRSAFPVAHVPGRFNEGAEIDNAPTAEELFGIRKEA